QFAFGIKTRSGVNHIIDLPLSRRAACIDQRRILAINRAGAAVSVGLAFKGIQHLHFITIQPKENAAVTPTLALAARRHRSRPFDMKLAIPKILQGTDVATAANTFHITVARNPLCREAIRADPLGQVFSVEQHHRVGRWFPGFFLSAASAGSYRWRLRPRSVMVQKIWVRLSLTGIAPK